MRYENLNPDPVEQVKALVRSANTVKTVPHGIKTVNPGEGLQLVAGDGSEIFWDWETANLFRSRIDAASELVAQGVRDMEQARADLDAAAVRIEDTEELLTGFEVDVAAAKKIAETTASSLTAVDSRLKTTAGELSTLKNTVGDVSKAAADADKRAANAEFQASSAASAASTAMSQYSTLSSKLDAALAAKPGMLTDPSFELAEMWQPSYGAQIVTSATAHSGSKVLLLPANNTNPAAGKAVHAYARQETPVIKGNRYRLTVYLRSAGEMGAQATGNFIARRGADAGYTYLANTGLVNLADSGITTGEWKIFQADWESPYDGPIQLGYQARYLTSDLEVDSLQGVDATEETTLRLQVEDAKKTAEAASRAAVEAAKAAGQAQSAANGKATITTGTTSATRLGLAVGDIHLRLSSLSAGASILSQERWDGSKWVENKIDSQFIANLDVGKLTGVFANIMQHLQAGSIGTKALTVGIGQNLVPNGGGQARAGWMGFGHNASGPTVNNGWPGSFWVLGRGNKTSDTFPVTPGEFAWTVSFKGQHAGGRTYVQLYCLDRDGATVASPYLVSNAVVPNGSFEDRSGKVTVPPGVVEAKFMVYAQHPNGVVDATKYQWYTGFTLKELVHGDLLVNGTVKGIHIEGSSVAAEVAKFIRVKAESVEVTSDLAARVANLMTANVKRLIVTEDAILQHTKLLGVTLVEELNVLGKIRGRDAILTGTVDLAQLNVTGVMSAEIARMMDATAKRLIVTEEAVMQHATVIGTLVTGELISERANLGDLAARMVAAGLIQTTTTANRGVKLTNAGIRAWDNSGNQTVTINGANNLLSGTFETGKTGARIRVASNSDSAFMDVYGPDSTTDHGSVIYTAGDSGAMNSAMTIMAMSTNSLNRNNPALRLFPLRGTFAFQGRWARDTDPIKFIYLTNNTGLRAGEYNTLTVPYVSAFPTNNALRWPFVSVESATGADVIATITSQTASALTLNVINTSSGKGSGALVVKIMTLNVGSF